MHWRNGRGRGAEKEDDTQKHEGGVAKAGKRRREEENDWGWQGWGGRRVKRKGAEEKAARNEKIRWKDEKEAKKGKGADGGVWGGGCKRGMRGRAEKKVA